MPFRITTFRTPLSQQEVEAQLRAITRARPSLLARLTEPTDTDARFEGEVEPTRFRITRVIRHRNSFLPVICGTLEQGNGGTTVRLLMRLHFFTAVFMLLWFGALVTFLLFMLASGGSAAAAAVILFGMLLVGGVLVSAFFFPESFRAEQLLRRALRAA